MTTDYHRAESSKSSSSSCVATAPAAAPRQRSYCGRARGQQEPELLSLPPHKQQAMLDKINATVASVLKSMVGDRPSNVFWKPKTRKNGISYYTDDNVDQDQYRFCCVSKTTAPIEEIMKLFLVTDTETLLKNYRIVYNNVLDARVLSVLSYPTSVNPFKSVYVRYSSFETPKLMDNRDMCLVVATDVFTHVDGSTIGYCLWDSVEIGECPDYSDTKGLVRSRMFRSGFFMRSTGTDGNLAEDGQDDHGHHCKTTKIVYLAGLEAGGIAPRLTTKLVMDKFGANLARVCSHFRRKNLDPRTFQPCAQWANKRDAKFCRGCLKKFNALVARTNCVACGVVVCKSCYTKEDVDLAGVGIQPMRFCFPCLEERGLDSEAAHASDSPDKPSSSRPRAQSDQSDASLMM